MFLYTPAPWVLTETSARNVFIQGAKGQDLAITSLRPIGFKRDEIRANLAAILCAPNLFSALASLGRNPTSAAVAEVIRWYERAQADGAEALTPGAWDTIVSEPYVFVIASNMMVVTVSVIDLSQVRTSTLGNAVIMAAAPDLLALACAVSTAANDGMVAVNQHTDAIRTLLDRMNAKARSLIQSGDPVVRLAS